MPRYLRDNLVNWQTPVTFIYSNMVDSVYGQTGSTTITTHTKSKKDMMNMLLYQIEKWMGPYVDVNTRRVHFGTSVWVGQGKPPR